RDDCSAFMYVVAVATVRRLYMSSQSPVQAPTTNCTRRANENATHAAPAFVIGAEYICSSMPICPAKQSEQAQKVCRFRARKMLRIAGRGRRPQYPRSESLLPGTVRCHGRITCGGRGNMHGFMNMSGHVTIPCDGLSATSLNQIRRTFVGGKCVLEART
ncbi:hypothetical protein Bbelb_217780, partial [Branchiostoma belcheri]